MRHRKDLTHDQQLLVSTRRSLIRLALVSLAITGSTMANAQTLERQLVASTGGSASAGSIQLDFSVGDLVVNTTTTTDLMLTQGFHQTYDFSTSVVASEVATFNIVAFPNPTRDQITIRVDGGTEAITYTLMDGLGRTILTAQTGTWNGTVLDLSDMAAGSYFLLVRCGEQQQMLRVQKVG